MFKCSGGTDREPMAYEDTHDYIRVHTMVLFHQLYTDDRKETQPLPCKIP
jgi:hypothetical protein